MTNPWNMTPAAIAKEIAIRRGQELTARSEGRGRVAAGHGQRIADLERVAGYGASANAGMKSATTSIPMPAAVIPPPLAAPEAISVRKLGLAITPTDAVQAAAEMVRRWGGTAAVRALQVALRSAEPMDVAEGVRMVQMAREVRA